MTNQGAPNFRLISVDPANPSAANWKTVIPEKQEALQGVTTAGGKLFARYLKDVSTRIEVYDESGKAEGEVALPGLGTASGFGGEKDEKFVFYGFTSYLSPGTIYRYDIASRKSTLHSGAPNALRLRSVRNEAGVCAEQGRHPGTHVSDTSQRPQTGR